MRKYGTVFHCVLSENVAHCCIIFIASIYTCSLRLAPNGSHPSKQKEIRKRGTLLAPGHPDQVFPIPNGLGQTGKYDVNLLNGCVNMKIKLATVKGNVC